MAQKVGWLVDSNQCISCRACEAACKAEYGLNAGQGRRRRVIEKTVDESGVIRTIFLSLACNHCANPACQAACPKGAYTKLNGAQATAMGIAELEGIVLHDPQLCVGCRRCEWACPYGAPQYNPETGKIHKCELCWQRIRAWKEDHSGANPFQNFSVNTADNVDRRRMPACVATCLGGSAIQLRGNETFPTAETAYVTASMSDYAYNASLKGRFVAPGLEGGENNDGDAGSAGMNRGSNYLAHYSLTNPALRIRNRVYVSRTGGVE